MKVKLGYCDNKVSLKSSGRTSLGSLTNTELNKLWKSKRLWSTSPGTNGLVADLTQYLGLEHRVEDFHVDLDENKRWIPLLNSLRTRLKHASLDCLQSWPAPEIQSVRKHAEDGDCLQTSFNIDLKFYFVIWKLALFREMVFLSCFPYVWTCMSIKLVIFETNQIHVGGASADRQR